MVSRVIDCFDDADLLGLAGSGDLWAAGELYDRYGPALYGLALALTADVATSERTVIQTFQRACSGRGQSRRGSSMWHDLAGQAYAISCELSAPSGSASAGAARRPQARLRALYALTMCGGYTYRQASTLLAVDADAVARDLRTLLCDARVRADAGDESSLIDLAGQASRPEA